MLSTLEGWPDYIFELIDGDYADVGHVMDNNNFVAIYFFFFIIIGSVVCVNLFVAIVSINFSES